MSSIRTAFCCTLIALVTATVRGAGDAAETLPGHLLGDRAVTARLALTPASIAPGDAVVATVTLVPEPGWHLYGPEHGDAGEPPAIAWQLPPGLHAGAIVFPPSLRVRAHGLTTYEYHGPVALQATLRASPALVAGRRVAVAADVTWAACSNVCVPGRARVHASLAIASVASPSSGASKLPAPVAPGAPAR